MTLYVHRPDMCLGLILLILFVFIVSMVMMNPYIS